MSREDGYDQPDLPEDQLRDYLTFLGLAFHHAQRLEQSLILVVILLHLEVNPNMSLDDIITLAEKMQNKDTLAKLLKRFKNRLPFENKFTVYFFDESLELRNLLTHHFIRARNQELTTRAGRRAVVLELTDIAHRLDTTTEVVLAVAIDSYGRMNLCGEELQDYLSQHLLATVNALAPNQTLPS